MLKQFALVLAVGLIIGGGCTSGGSTNTAALRHIVYTRSDTVICTITGGDILMLNALSAGGDTIAFETGMIEKILHKSSGLDVTDQYVNKDLVNVELAKREAITRRKKLEQEVAAGKRTARDLELQAPIEILFAKINSPGTQSPSVSFVLFNLSNKTIDMFKVKVYCKDSRGRSLRGTGGRDHVFQASSQIPIEGGKDFSTSLLLPYHPGTARATVEVYYLEFADRTWWRGDQSLEIN